MSKYHYAITLPDANALLRRKRFLERSIAKLEKRLATAPEGSLIVGRRKTKTAVWFYHSFDGGKKRSYLNRSEVERIRALAQKEYDQKALHLLREELKLLPVVLRYVKLRKIEDASALCLPEKREYMEPLILSDEDCRQAWLKQDYIRKAPDDGKHVFATEKGDKVCSKTESMEADFMFRHGFDYLYEKRLELTDHGRSVWRYPDFTIWDPVAREEVIFEHFGMVDDEGYQESMFDKIRLYEENGYVIGKNFLFTFETKEHPFTTEQLARILQARFGR